MVGHSRRNESSSRFSRRPCLGDSGFVVAMLVVAAVGVGSVDGQLSMGYYANSCPGAESIITTAVRTASVVDPVLPAKILRLFFHDCFVQVSYLFNFSSLPEIQDFPSARRWRAALPLYWYFVLFLAHCSSPIKCEAKWSDNLLLHEDSSGKHAWKELPTYT